MGENSHGRIHTATLLVLISQQMLGGFRVQVREELLAQKGQGSSTSGGSTLQIALEERNGIHHR